MFVIEFLSKVISREGGRGGRGGEGCPTKNQKIISGRGTIIWNWRVYENGVLRERKQISLKSSMYILSKRIVFKKRVLQTVHAAIAEIHAS